MEHFFTPSNIMFTLGLLSILFSVYNYFRNPIIKADKTDALMEQRLQSSQESTDRRFSEIQDNFKSLLLQSNNHIHTVDTKVETLTSTVTEMSKEIVKLSTIISERIPQK